MVSEGVSQENSKSTNIYPKLHILFLDLGVAFPLSSMTVMELYEYGERLARNPEPISNLYKNEELDENGSDTVSEESTLLLADMPQNKNYNGNTGSVIVHSNEAAVFDKSNVRLVTMKKRGFSNLFLSCFGRGK